MSFGNLSIKVNADIGKFTTSMDIARQSAYESMTASAASTELFRQGMLQTSNTTQVAAQNMANSMQAANDAISQSSVQAADSIKNISDTADKADFRSLGEKISEAIGVGIGAGIVAANKAWDGFVEYSKTKAIVIGAAVTAIFAVAGLGAVYTAYKVIKGSLGFITGLLTGDSYKSDNIDALVEANDQVKEIQKSLGETAAQAAVTNEAISALGINKSDYISVFTSAQKAIESNKEVLDELGLTYGSTEELIQSANAKLSEYTEGMDRNYVAAKIGIGAAAQVADAAKNTAQAQAEATARLREYNLVMGPETQASVQRYTDTMREFNNNTKLTSDGFKRAIADNIMPMLTDLADFFKDGFPFAVRTFRYTIAEITSVVYGLKTVFYTAGTAIVGAIDMIGFAIIAVEDAIVKLFKGDLKGAADALVNGWESGAKRINEVGQNIVDQARHNSAAMKQAWGFNDSDGTPGGSSKGKSADDVKLQEQVKQQAEAYNKLSGALKEKIDLQSYEVQLNAKVTDGQREAIKFTNGLADGTIKMTDAQKQDYAQMLETLITTEKKNKQMEDARKAASKSTADTISDYQKLTQSINDKIATASADVLSTEKLTEAEKLRAKFITDLRDKVITMTETERQAYEGRLKVLDTLEKSKQAQEDMAKAMAAVKQESDNAISAAQQEAQSNQALADTFGMTKTQISQEELARLENQLAQRASIGMTLNEVVALEKLIAAKRESVKALTTVDNKQAVVDAAKHAADEAAAYEAAYQQSNKKIDDGLYEALSRSGDAGLKKLLKDAKEWFARLVLNPIISPIASFGAALLNPNAASAQGTAGSAIGAAGNIAGAYSGLSNLGGTIGSGLMSAGSALGSSSIAGFGSGLAATAGTDTGLAAMYASTATAGNLSAGAAIGGEVGAGASGIMGGASAALGAIPVIGWIALAVAAAAYFGSGKDRVQTGVGVSGDLGTDNLTRDVSWTKDGGWFNSDTAGTWKYNLGNSSTTVDGKSYSDPASQASDQALKKALDDGYAALKASTKSYAAALGLNADQIASRTDAINFSMGKDQAETTANIQKMFGGVADSMAADLFPSFTKFAAANETASQTLARVAVDFQGMNDALKALGLKLFSIDDAGIAASEGLIKLLGGLQSAQNIASSYYSNFYSASEKAALETQQLTDAFSSAGLVLPKTKEDYKQLVEQLQKTGTPEQLASALKLSSAFTTLTASLSAAAQEAAAVQAAIDQQTQAWQAFQGKQQDQQIAALTLEGKAAEALALTRYKELQAMDASLRPMQQYIYQLQDQASATAEAAAVAKQHRDLDIQLMTALGDSEGALAAQRADALIGLDSYSKGIQTQIWAANDAAAANQKAKDSAAAALQAQQQADQAAQQAMQQAQQAYDQRLTAAKTALQNAYNAESTALQNIINKMQSFATAARAMQQTLLSSATSPDSIVDQYANGKADLPNIIAGVQSGDQNAIAKMQKFVELSQQSSTDFNEYRRDFSVAQNTLDQAATSAEQQVKQATSQLDLLKQQVDGLLNVNNSVLSVAEAIGQLNAVTQSGLISVVNAVDAKSAANSVGISATATPTSPSYASTGPSTTINPADINPLSSGEQDSVKKALENYVLQKYNVTSLQGGMAKLDSTIQPVLDDVLQQLKDSINTKSLTQSALAGLMSSELTSLNSLSGMNFAQRSSVNAGQANLDLSGILSSYMIDGSHENGLDYVPWDGYRAELHQGERVLTASQTKKADEGDAKMIAELKDMHAVLLSIVNYTGKTFKALDTWNANGMPATAVS